MGVGARGKQRRIRHRGHPDVFGSKGGPSHTEGLEAYTDTHRNRSAVTPATNVPRKKRLRSICM